jgi:hypothetical protein
VLSSADIAQFEQEGFVRIDEAFPRVVADAGREILWRASGCDPSDRGTWTQPVVRLGLFGGPPFAEAANTSVLHAAFDQLVGKGRWQSRPNLGTFPIRFPSSVDAGDTGWHIDASFGTDASDFMSWRANVFSRGRALLMLFLFSDVGEHDAPTRIRVGSHRDIARRLAPAGEAGLSLRELAAHGFETTEDRREVLASGPAGTVYLCHPFLVHAAQVHRGTEPRFMAQPPLQPVAPELSLQRDDGDYSPVERAIRDALKDA